MAHICGDAKGRHIIQNVFKRALTASEINLDLAVNDILEQAVVDLVHLSPTPLKQSKEQAFFEKTLKEIPEFEEFRGKILYNKYPGSIKIEARTRELISLGLFEDALNQYALNPNKQLRKVPKDLFSYFVRQIISSKTKNEGILNVGSRLISLNEKIPLDILPQLIIQYQAFKWPKCEKKLLDEFASNGSKFSSTDLCRIYLSSLDCYNNFSISPIYIPFLKYSNFFKKNSGKKLKFGLKTSINQQFVDVFLSIISNGPEFGTVKISILKQLFLSNKVKGAFIKGLAATVLKSKIKPTEDTFEQYINQVKLVIEANAPKDVITGLLDFVLEFVKSKEGNERFPVEGASVLWSYLPGRTLLLNSMSELDFDSFLRLLRGIFNCYYYIDYPSEESFKIVIEKFNSLLTEADNTTEFESFSDEVVKILIYFKYINKNSKWNERWNPLVAVLVDKINNEENRSIIMHLLNMGMPKTPISINFDHINEIDSEEDLYKMYRNVLAIETSPADLPTQPIPEPDKDMPWGDRGYFNRYPDSDHLELANLSENLISGLEKNQYNVEEINDVVKLNKAVVDYPKLLLSLSRRSILIDNMDILAERLLEYLPSFDLYQACSIGWSLAALNYLPIELVTFLASSINIKLENMQLEPLSGSRLLCFLTYLSKTNPFIFFNQVIPFSRILIASGFGNKNSNNSFHYKDSILYIDNQEVLSKIVYEHSNFFDDSMREFLPFYYDGMSHRIKTVLSYHPSDNAWVNIGSNLSISKYKKEQLKDQASPGGRLMQERFAESVGYRAIKIDSYTNLHELK